jgi:integrase
LDKWLEFSETNQRQRPRTIYENRVKIENRLRPRFGHLRLDRLKPDVIDAAYGDWLAEGLAPATVSKYHAILSAALRQAVKWDWIDRVPTDRATPPSLVRREMVVPTPEQLVKLVSAAERFDPILASAFALAALTGMRRGELVALR